MMLEVEQKPGAVSHSCNRRACFMSAGMRSSVGAYHITHWASSMACLEVQVQQGWSPLVQMSHPACHRDGHRLDQGCVQWATLLLQHLHASPASAPPGMSQGLTQIGAFGMHEHNVPWQSPPIS